MVGARAVRGVLLALLVALPLAAAQQGAAWDQLAGGAARTGAAFLPATTLDVLEARDLFGNDTSIALHYAKGLVSTPHGLLALAVRDEACVLIMIGERDVTERVLDSCDSGTLTTYDRANDRLLICSEGGPTEPILQARDAATGELVWALTPARLQPGAQQGLVWGCRGTALVPRDGVAYVAFFAAQGTPGAVGTVVASASQLARIQTRDGTVDWTRNLLVAEFYSPDVPEVRIGDLADERPGGGFLPFGVSVTDSGVVVSGRASCACGKGDPLAAPSGFLQQGAVAWIDAADGSLEGRVLAEEDPEAIDEGVPERRYGQWWATTQGPLAAFALGGRVFVVNAEEEAPVREARFEGIETGRGFIGIIPSVWWSGVLLMPVAKSLTALDATSLEARWSRTFGDEWTVSGLLALPPSDAIVLVANSDDAATDGDGESTSGDVRAVLHRLDLATGDELQRIPLPGTIRMTGGTGRVGFQPLDDGRLLVYTLDGRLFTLGHADPALVPRVSISNAYPAPSEGVTVSVENAAANATYLIAWGDGTVAEGGREWTHRYGESSPRAVRVTALFADGRTATAERVVRVGAAPPPELNALQRAFAPGNQDLTFGILGILVTLVGALIALFVRRRRHGRLHEELRALERIRQDGRRDPAAAIRALGRFRERLLAEVGTRALDDAQFHTLDARASVVFSALRTRLLGPLAGSFSADFRHALDVVLHDGRVDDEELAALRQALAAERDVGPEERARLLGILDRMAHP